MLFSDTTVLDLYEGSRLSWKVKTAYLERWGGTDSIFVKPIFADIYDSLGNKAAFLRADSGNLNMRMTFVRAYGRVYALSPKGAAVRADSLLWLKKDDIIRTDGPVRVVGETGDVLQGIGFISDSRLENWHIRSNVTGIFQDAAKRLKEEDSKLIPQENK
jgi:LPS export ABC transporter protein LptC